jgi:multidrug resistance efflux pump
LPEGSRVKAGEVVCVLDSSALRVELLVQKLRHLQARARVEQTRSILEASMIALREYERGILAQDVTALRRYVGACAAEGERAQRNLAWSQALLAKGLRTGPQVKVDALSLQEAEIALRDAEGMLRRLVNYTGKRIVTAHRAKIAAIRADMLAQTASFHLESERLDRIQAMIANCTMRAPRDGIVLHANRENGWGTVTLRIREGLVVYPAQPIFWLLDPRSLQVRAKVNESQVARIKLGQRAQIFVDAFPEHPLRGTVTQIATVAEPASGPLSDVRVYIATLRIDSGGLRAARLRAGLSAHVTFQMESRRDVTRIPLEAVRWAGGQTFAAMAAATVTGLTWRWRPIALGATDAEFAEVLAGLAPGDRVVAAAGLLPAPGLDADSILATTAVAMTKRPRAD